ncbi:MAG: aminoglycoside phosphotransferase family protein [Actinomycetota bacterium]|nr:aminoglycoside phosphotransferase family protein [Actinomycetota bacterium]
MRIPQPLVREWAHERAWIDHLPRLVVECSERWGIELEEPVETPHSLVVPAGDVVLKLNAPSHYEADHEADALAVWAGAGAARLLARDDARRALLLERCRPGTRLWDAGGDAPAVVADILPRLARSLDAPHPFRLLADEAERWAEEVPERYDRSGRPFERRVLELAVDVFRSADTSAASLVNQDLHGGNILRAEREPWLVIDPKPLVGERELDAVGLLRNAALRREPLDRWLDVLAALGLDRDRARGWGIAHALAWGWEVRRGWSEASIHVARTIAAA